MRESIIETADTKADAEFQVRHLFAIANRNKKAPA